MQPDAQVLQTVGHAKIAITANIVTVVALVVYAEAAVPQEVARTLPPLEVPPEVDIIPLLEEITFAYLPLLTN